MNITKYNKLAEPIPPPKSTTERSPGSTRVSGSSGGTTRSTRRSPSWKMLENLRYHRTKGRLASDRYWLVMLACQQRPIAQARDCRRQETTRRTLIEKLSFAPVCRTLLQTPLGQNSDDHGSAAVCGSSVVGVGASTSLGLRLAPSEMLLAYF